VKLDEDTLRLVEEFPALPGDVIVGEGGDRYLVRWAVLNRRDRSHPCGCCHYDEHEYDIYIEEPWDGPIEVITKGGGTALIMPLKEWWGDWPPENATVFRDGHQIHPKPRSNPVREMEFTLEPDEMNP